MSNSTDPGAKPDMTGKTVLITGANAGIGKATAQALASMGATVLAAGRDHKKIVKAVTEIQKGSGNDRVRPLLADLSSLQEVRHLASEVGQITDRLDVLINNAGIMLSKHRQTVDGYDETLAVNHLAPFVLTRELTHLLIASAPARVITVSSGWHVAARAFDFDNLNGRKKYDAKVAYQQSKLANILFTRALSRKLAGTGVTANCLHPGVVRTNIGRDGDVTGAAAFMFTLARPFLLSPEAGARTSVFLASSDDVSGVTGQYFVKGKIAEPSPAAQDDAAAERLWRESERLAGNTRPATAERPAPQRHSTA